MTSEFQIGQRWRTVRGSYMRVIRFSRIYAVLQDESTGILQYRNRHKPGNMTLVGDATSKGVQA